MMLVLQSAQDASSGHVDLQVRAIAHHTQMHTIRELRLLKPIVCYPVNEKAPKAGIFDYECVRMLAPAF
jgi:hypothetical protein